MAGPLNEEIPEEETTGGEAMEEELERPEEREREEEQLRREATQPIEDIDYEFYEQFIAQRIQEWDMDHSEYMQDREEWLAAARDLSYQPSQSGESEIHLPYTTTMAKSMHARIFQIFSQDNIFTVKSRKQIFQDREASIQDFIRWAFRDDLNRGEGFKPVLDRLVKQCVDEGSMIMKWGWDRWEHTYKELTHRVKIERVTEIVQDEMGDYVEETTDIPVKELAEIETTRKHSAGFVEEVPVDDFRMPAGFHSVQRAPWCSHRLYFTDNDIKTRIRSGKFDKEAGMQALENRRQPDIYGSDNLHGSQKRETLANIEGISSRNGGSGVMTNVTENHVVEEFYVSGYVKKYIDGEEHLEVDEVPAELVLWYHHGSKKILGWNYLHEVCNDGERPFDKSDYMPSEERSIGVGVPELLYAINMYMDAMHQLKMDNGYLASLQWGTYRATSSLRADTFRMRPGELIPVEDPNDVKVHSFPYLGNFGQEEESVLNSYGEKLLALNDINLGNLSGKGVAGALRNATGAAFVDKQSNVQLHPHLDRIVRGMRRMLRAVFVLYREKKTNDIFYRVTGEDGRPIFGQTNREALQGDFDFDLDVDALGTSDAEKQQRATLLVQTLANPTFMQLGIVTPSNQYNALENLLKSHGIKDPYLYITKPPEYTEPVMPPEQRFLQIVMGLNNPPIHLTVRPNEDHQAALTFLRGLQEDANLSVLGMLDTQEKLSAYVKLMQTHEQMLQMMQNPNPMPNISGTQMPAQGGLPAMDSGGIPSAGQPEQGPLGSPQGEVNGPVY